MAEIPSPVFPQELFDFIIDYLHNDKDTLRSCSLASKRLVDTSFYHLFDSVTFKILPGEERRPGGRLWNDLVAFVTGESRAVRYIRRLYLDTVDPPTVFNYTSDSPRAYPVVLLQNLVSVLRHIPSLQHVGIYHIMIVTNSIGGNVDRLYENGTRRLQSLSLCWCGLDDRVLALPSITRAIAPLKLSLHHIRCISNRSSPSSIPEASATSSCPVSNLQIIGAFPICGSTDDQDLQLVTSNLMPSLYSSLRELTLIGREHEGSTVCQCVSHE
ncbi:hypothetical protein QCA50_004236 [Cerrena zonata]|uniref:F-box domain-containing protein n=1 Tax=Cerrena zonata TaxID=2478898 RepID=A0AAW0GSW1_9APHY